MKFGLLEIGSTNTKAYLYHDGQLQNCGSKFIAFKNHYKENHKILKSDKEELFSFAKELKEKATTVYAVGTSGFRIMEQKDQEQIIGDMKQELDIDLKIVSSSEECEYTVKGVLQDIDYQDKMAIVIGGGGSTEIAIVENKKIIDKINLPFGSMDITDHFPDLNADITTTPFEQMWEYTHGLVGKINHKVEAIVLAGGDFLYFYETVGYEMKPNHLYHDKKQPYCIERNQSNEYDKDILTRSLDAIKKKCPGNENWWIGARGMRFCINTIAYELDAKYIIPTRINMLIGLAGEIEKRTEH